MMDKRILKTMMSVLLAICLVLALTKEVVSVGETSFAQQNDGGDDGEIGKSTEGTTPWMIAYLSEGFVIGYGWLAGENVSLYIDLPGGFPGEYDYIGTFAADVYGSVKFTPPFDLVPDTYLVMSNGTTTRTHTIYDISIAYVNEGDDEVGGYADPEPGVVNVHAITDAVNTAKTAGVNADEWWLVGFADVFDIIARTHFYALQEDPAGNFTQVIFWINAPPDNDYLNNPHPVVIPQVPFEHGVNTISASYQPESEPVFTACGQAAGNASVWYKFSPAVNGEMSLDTFGSNYNTMLGVWAGYPGSTGTPIACNNNAGTSLQSKLTFTYTSGITYYIGVAQYGSPQMGGFLKLSATTFADVAGNHPMWRYIEGLYAMGVTGGCTTTSPLKYCPNNVVTRQQMAIFLLRAKYNASHMPPPATGIFTDVPMTSSYAPWIEELYGLGITGGCRITPLSYCPEQGVTRAQIAVFLLRAKEGSAYMPPPATGKFADVPVTSSYAPWIEELYSRGVTGGCSITPLSYCPGNPVTRAQMAVFVDKTFGIIPLPLPIP